MSRDNPVTSFRALRHSVWQWWRDNAASAGALRATLRMASILWEFVRESTPGRRKLRYGDAEFDWDHRVDTTSGSVGWRDRLMGVFHSPYQPTEAALFYEMLDALCEHTGYDCREFTFVDLGSGKGRTLLMASHYLFQRVIGVELLPALNSIAVQNIRDYKNDGQKCFAIESICADATEYVFPDEAIVLYLFNPLPEAGLRRVLDNLARNPQRQPGKVYVIYHNPMLEAVLRENRAWKEVFRTHQYAIYESQ